MSVDNFEQTKPLPDPETRENFERKLTEKDTQLAEKERQIEDLREKLHGRDIQIATLKEIIDTDVITNLRSRRATEEKLSSMDERRHGDTEGGMGTEVKKRVAVLILDIDHFKTINDTYGHHAGDEALRQVGKFLKKRFRQSDFIGRWGGEEFLLLLKAPDLDILINKFYDKASGQARLGFEADIEGKKILITFSGGITLLEPEEKLGGAIGRADKALYAAKKGVEGEDGERILGRNQILPYAAQMREEPEAGKSENMSL